MTGGRVVRKGEPGFLAPGSDEWARVITPSKVAAILGLSRWESPFRLWCRMKGIVPPEPPKDAFDIGHDMEPYAANRWVRRNPGWNVSAGEVQFHVPSGHFPFPAVGTIDRRTSRGSWRRILEVKIARNLSDAEVFGDPDLTGSCPPDYAAQVTAQRLFVAAAQPSAKWLPTSHLLALGPYFNERVYEVDYDLDVAAWIIDECADFWRSLDADTPPPLDDHPATYTCLKQLHPDIDDAVVDIDPELAIDYLRAKQAEKDAAAAAVGASSRMLAAMGRAKYAKVGRVVNEAGTDLVGGITVGDRRKNGKGGVSLYAGRTTADKIRQAVTNPEGNQP